jgi:glycosyltransferase involved in cell wall biosynthesis
MTLNGQQLAPAALTSAPPSGWPGRPVVLDATNNADVWIVVAAFNEARMVGPVVGELLTICPNVVVVDDGSLDGTGDEALTAGASVVTHAFNLGQGAALQTGLEYALIRGATYVATFDADGQHHATDLAHMIAALRREPVDIVLGSRFLGHAAGMPWSRRLLLRAAVYLSTLTTGVRLTDAHNGMRVLTADAARRLRISQNRMAHASELVAQIGRLGFRVSEVPVTISYTRYSLQKGQRLSDGLRILIDLFAGWLLR